MPNPKAMTELFGFEMEQQTRTMLLDLMLASVVIFFIMLPQFCFKVEGKTLRPKDEDKDE